MLDHERETAAAGGDSPIAFDDLDRAMIQLLREDGRMSTVTLARRLGVTEPTARRRLKRLLSTGSVRIRALLDPRTAAPNGASVIIMLQVDLDKLEEVGDRIAAMPYAASVTITGGEFNLLITSAMETPAVLLDFLTRDLGALAGIRNWRVISSIKVLKLGQAWVPQSMQGMGELFPPPRPPAA